MAHGAPLQTCRARMTPLPISRSTVILLTVRRCPACSSVSSLPEVVGDAAEIVNPENVFDIARGIREVLLNRERRAQLVERGFHQLKRFS